MSAAPGGQGQGQGRAMGPLFISLEGIDGAGKSTHVEGLAAALRERGHAVCVTREPGGSPLAERIRALLLDAPMDGVTEALLAFAGRRDHVETVIRPALARGETVVCDRYTDATFAYQGGGRGVALPFLRALEAEVQAGLAPDLTLWFDADASLAAARRAHARAADRFEAEDVAFFERVRTAYADRARAEPGRIVRIDATASVDAVRAAVWQAVRERLGAMDTRGARP